MISDQRREQKRLWYRNNTEKVKLKNDRYRVAQRSDPAKWIRQALYVSKHRAIKKDIPFNLVPEDVEVTFICPVFGTILEYGKGKNNPNGPSLDRHIPNLGYVKGNIQIMSNRANTLKQDATTAEVSMLLKYMEKFS